MTFGFKPYTREEFLEVAQEVITAQGGVPVQTVNVDVRDVGAMDTVLQEIATILRVRAGQHLHQVRFRLGQGCREPGNACFLGRHYQPVRGLLSENRQFVSMLTKPRVLFVAGMVFCCLRKPSSEGLNGTAPRFIARNFLQTFFKSSG